MPASHRGARRSATASPPVPTRGKHGAGTEADQAPAGPEQHRAQDQAPVDAPATGQSIVGSAQRRRPSSDDGEGRHRHQQRADQDQRREGSQPFWVTSRNRKTADGSITPETVIPVPNSRPATIATIGLAHTHDTTRKLTRDDDGGNRAERRSRWPGRAPRKSGKDRRPHARCNCRQVSHRSRPPARRSITVTVGMSTAICGIGNPPSRQRNGAAMMPENPARGPARLIGPRSVAITVLTLAARPLNNNSNAVPRPIRIPPARACRGEQIHAIPSLDFPRTNARAARPATPGRTRRSKLCENAPGCPSRARRPSLRQRQAATSSSARTVSICMSKRVMTAFMRAAWPSAMNWPPHPPPR